MTSARVLAGLACLACLAGLVTSCSQPGAVPPPDPEVTVQVLQYRRDVADRAIEVKVENPGESALTVDAVELEFPGFGAVPRTEEDAVLAPGRRVDLRLPLGPTDCTTTATARTPVVRLWLDGSTEPAVLEVTDPRALVKVHQRECAEQAVREVLDVRFVTDAWERRGRGDSLVVHGVLRVDPDPGSSATVTALEGSTLFAVTPEPLPPRVDDAVDVPLTLLPQRCDPHAVGESKRGYTFGVRVGVEGQDDVLLPVEPDPAGRSLLEDALLERCGLLGSPPSG